MKDIYDDEKIVLEAKLSGTDPAIAKIKTVDFVVTTTKQGIDTDKPKISVPVKRGFPTSTATHDYTPDPVDPGQDFYVVKYKAEASLDSTPYSQTGSEEFRIWPKEIQLTFIADDGKAHDKAKFKLEYTPSNKRSAVETSGSDGKFSKRMDKSCFKVEMISPWAFDGAQTHTGSKRTHKIKKSAYQIEFVAPAVANATAKTKQYVNLDPGVAGWKVDAPFGHVLEFKVGGKGDTARKVPERVAQQDDIVYIQVEFTPATTRNDPQPKLLPDNLDGAPTSENSDKTWKGKIKLDAQRQATFKVELGHAGGDAVKVKIGTSPACSDATLEFETWRRLYYELMYADAMTPVMKPAGGGKHDLPAGIKTLVDGRLAAAFIEYECKAHHKYTKTMAPAGSVVAASYLGLAGRERVITGGSLSQADPVAFGAADNRTIHIKMVDVAYSTRTKLSSLKQIQVDAKPYEYTRSNPAVVAAVDVGGRTWRAVIANPNAYQAAPTLTITPGQTIPDAHNRPYVIKVIETKQNQTLVLTYARGGGGVPADTLAPSEQNKIDPFVLGLLTPSELRKHGNVVQLEIAHPSNAGTRVGDLRNSLQLGFDTQKAVIYAHPGLNDDGSVKSGPVDASWFTATAVDKFRIDLPTSGNLSQPGDFVGPLSASKCPVEVEFKVSNSTYEICGNSGGGKQLFVLDSTFTNGALASTLCHELGHAMGMTIMAGGPMIPPGTAAALHVDNGGVYYVDGMAPFGPGERDLGAGEHCASGVPPVDLPDSTFNGSEGSCIMFHSGDAPDNQPSFCATCQGYLQARKLTDIRSDWGTRAPADS